MKATPAAFAAALTALTLCAGGKVRITDATGSDSNAAGRFALPWAARGKLELSVRKLEAGAALEKLAVGDTDLVLLRKDDLPPAFTGRRRIYAHRALIAAVNARNPVRSVTRSQLKRLISAPRPVWSAVGGDGIDIHRYAVKLPDGKLVGERELNLFAAADEILRLGSIGEAVLLTEADPAALAWGPFLPELPPGVVALRIDGKEPSMENIRNGSYPLQETYVAVLGDSPPAAAEELFGMLGTEEFYDALAADGLIPPAAAKAK